MKQAPFSLRDFTVTDVQRIPDDKTRTDIMTLELRELPMFLTHDTFGITAVDADDNPQGCLCITRGEDETGVYWYCWALITDALRKQLRWFAYVALLGVDELAAKVETGMLYALVLETDTQAKRLMRWVGFQDTNERWCPAVDKPPYEMWLFKHVESG